MALGHIVWATMLAIVVAGCSSDAKDNLEDSLHRAVCGGTLAHGDAQRPIAGDRIAAWEAAGEP